MTEIIGAIKELAGLTNRIIDRLDTPEKRAQARREYRDKLDTLRLALIKETDVEKVDALVSHLHSLISDK